MNKLEEQWKKERIIKWFFNKNYQRANDLAFDELVIKKSDLGWWKRNWNNKKDLDWVINRTAKIIAIEYDALVSGDEQ